MTLKTPENQAIVIFGATGDLTGRKLMPALYNLFAESLLPQDFAVVGYGRTEMTSEEFREHEAANVAKYSRTGLDPEAWEHFARHVDYLAGDLDPDSPNKVPTNIIVGAIAVIVVILYLLGK